MKFLTARWRHLLFANYSVDPSILKPFVPVGTKLDEFHGQAFVSLVAFTFGQTRVIGIPIPLHTSFEEVNLRFYVTPHDDDTKRAVCFIREIVPRRAIPAIANTLYCENYVTLPMDHGGDTHRHWYVWGDRLQNSIVVVVQSDLDFPAEGSVGQFITEHYWGYSTGTTGTLEYRVQHPPWRCCEVNDYEIRVDFGSNYGQSFACLSNRRPDNVQYAAGSAVQASFPRRFTAVDAK